MTWIKTIGTGFSLSSPFFGLNLQCAAMKKRNPPRDDSGYIHFFIVLSVRISGPKTSGERESMLVLSPLE
jgi:hypothetical protein